MIASLIDRSLLLANFWNSADKNDRKCPAFAVFETLSTLFTLEWLSCMAFYVSFKSRFFWKILATDTAFKGPITHLDCTEEHLLHKDTLYLSNL